MTELDWAGQIPLRPLDQWHEPEPPYQDDPGYDRGYEQVHQHQQNPAAEQRELINLSITLAKQRAHQTGGTFILDVPDTIAAVWGTGNQVLAAAGEPTMICGPTGIGKTTVCQQVVLNRLGIGTGEVLGYPVSLEHPDKRILYLACDRPNQAARSFRRMVSEEHRDTLDQRLEVWRGPLPVDVMKSNEALLAMADHFGAGTIVVDSLKDIVAKLSDDESANRANQAFQACTASGVELLILHHQRKKQAGGEKPKSIADVYGSTWLTAGMGSVILLWGEPGDLVVELSHLKQPADNVGPFTVVHDHEHGITAVEAGTNALDLMSEDPFRTLGLTVTEAAKALFRTTDPNRNETERARRKLEALVPEYAYRRPAGRDARTGQQLPITYFRLVNTTAKEL